MDFIWWPVTTLIAWFVIGKGLEAYQRNSSAVMIGFVSWIVFRLFYFAVKNSPGANQHQALLSGIIFGCIVILACWGIRMWISKNTRNVSDPQLNQFIKEQPF